MRADQLARLRRLEALAKDLERDSPPEWMDSDIAAAVLDLFGRLSLLRESGLIDFEAFDLSVCRFDAAYRDFPVMDGSAILGFIAGLVDSLPRFPPWHVYAWMDEPDVRLTPPAISAGPDHLDRPASLTPAQLAAMGVRPPRD